MKSIIFSIGIFISPAIALSAELPAECREVIHSVVQKATGGEDLISTYSTLLNSKTVNGHTVDRYGFRIKGSWESKADGIVENTIGGCFLKSIRFQ